MTPARAARVTKGKERRFPRLDILRALAALLVFAYHVGYEAGTNEYDRLLGAVTNYLDVGVAIFFAISGFLLYRPFVASRFGGSRQRRVGGYAKARVLRILPAYWVALTAAAAIPGLIVLPSDHWWIFYGLLQAYTRYEPFGLPQAWSLSVEATFYIALPVFAWLVARIIGTRPWAAAEYAVLAALAVGGAVVQTGLSYYAIAGTFDWFAVGMALAILNVRAAQAGSLPRPLQSLASRRWMAWGCAVGVFALTCWAESTGLTGDAQYFVKSCGYALCAGLALVPAVFDEGRDLGRAGRKMVWLGTISYGIFLYHLPILLLVMRLGWESKLFGRPVLGYAVFGMTGTLVMATLSWHLIERPALRLRGRFARRPMERQSPPADVSGRASPTVAASREHRVSPRIGR